MSKALQQKLIGLIITFNEEKNISELIQNLDFVDEIILIDSFSTDRTVAIASTFSNVSIYLHHFQDYASQRNIALQYAKNHWVLFLDADERISPVLQKEILETVQLDQKEKAYFFKRRFFFNAKPVYFGGLQTDKNVRLFYNSSDTYYKGLVHEKLQIQGTFHVLKNFLTHYSYEDYASYKEKMYRYGILKGQEKIAKGKQANSILKFLHPSYTFLCKLILRGGVLDGSKGLILSYLMAYSVFIRYQEMERFSNTQRISSEG